MEYIKFNQNVTIENLLNILELIKVKYEFKNKKINTIFGISNGLCRINYTLCFLEKISDCTQLNGLENALIFSNITYTEEYKNYNIVYLEDARYAFIKILEYLSENFFLTPFTTTTPYEKCHISSLANIHKSTIVEDEVVIEDGVIIGAGCVIKNGTYIGKNSIIRENCTIGCDGIGLYKAKNNEVLRFKHIGGVFIGSNVEIGANCVIAKGTLSNTKISDDTVIGNLSNIGHGVKIGKKVWISVGSIIGGNTIFEDYVTIGLGANIKDNIFIAENSTVGMGSVVTKSIMETCIVFGNPATPMKYLKAGPRR